MLPAGSWPDRPTRRRRSSRWCRIRAYAAVRGSARPAWTCTASAPARSRTRSSLCGAWAEGDTRVLFVGKLLVSKGVDLLAAAWPLVHRARRAAGARSPRLLFIGFGAFEAGLRLLVDGLARGDIDAAREVAATGRGLEGDEDKPLPILCDFLADPPDG